MLEFRMYHRWVDVRKFSLYKGQREVHGAPSWTLKVNAVQKDIYYEGHSTGLAQGSIGMKACEVAELQNCNSDNRRRT